MIRFGVLSYAGAGHLNPMIALSKELASRGHSATLFLPPHCEQKVRANGLDFVPIVVPEHIRHLPASAELERPTQWSDGVRARINRIDAEIGAFLAQYPSRIRDAGVDALIIDEIIFAGPTVAEVLKLPYIVLSTSIPHNFGWDPSPSVPMDGPWQARLADKMLQVSVFCMRGPLRICLDRYRQQLGLSGIDEIGEIHPHCAHITQWPRCLDSRQIRLPDNFHYTGPFATSERTEETEFPWDRLDGRPLVYASLGTTKRADPSLFYRVAEACVGVDVQLAISLGGRLDPECLADMPGDPILVRVAPQLELLRIATAVITHAGPNTVLESLLQGKPMVALPLTLDQPAVAERVAGAGAAEVLPPGQRSVDDIRSRLVKILNEPAYRGAAEKLQKQMTRLRGVSTAADIIETAISPELSVVTTTTPL